VNSFSLSCLLEGGDWMPLFRLLIAVLPVGFKPFFRFRLWHYLAYTALVAVELAYYSRWQG